MSLAAQKAHHLEIRGSEQRYDAGSGLYSTVPVRLVVKGTPKTTSLGSFEPGSTTDTTTELEASSLKQVVGGTELVEIDKYTYIAKFNGADALQSVRADLGLA